MTDPAHPLTLWLARGSMAALGAAFLMQASGHRSTRRSQLIWRVCWTIAWVVLVLHVLAAFHFEHDWSLTVAWQHTAEQTARVTGIDHGGGLYVNFAFLLLWGLDAIFLWREAALRREASPRRGASPQNSGLHRTTEFACLFMAFNATVVFGPAWWTGAAAAFAVAFFVVWKLSRRSRPDRR